MVVVSEILTCDGGEGFFEDGLEEVGGVGAGVLDLRFQRPAGRHRCFHTLHDRGLLGEGWEGDWNSI